MAGQPHGLRPARSVHWLKRFGRPVRRGAARAPGVVTVPVSAPGQRGGRGDGISSHGAGGHAGQDGVEQGSPIRSGGGEVAMGSYVEEVVGVGWAPMTDSVCRELPELEGRRGKRMSTRPRRRNVRGAMSSPWRGKSAVMAAREAARSGRGTATGMDQRP
jgi:hypothetical protein